MRTTFLLLMWLMLSSCDGRESGAALRMPTFPCDREFFPNINTLIHILCTLPITSAECERSFDTLRRLKTGDWVEQWRSEDVKGGSPRIFLSCSGKWLIFSINCSTKDVIDLPHHLTDPTALQNQKNRSKTVHHRLRSVNAKVLYVRNGKDFRPTVFVGTNLEPPPPP